MRRRRVARSCVWANPRNNRAARTKQGGGSARTASTAPARERLKRSNGAPRTGKIYAPCMIRGVRAAKAAPSWQDLRAVRSQTAVCGAFRMHGAHILPKPAHFGCMAAICCRELALFPSEAPSGTHEAKKLPRIAARKRIAAISCHCRTPGSTFLSSASARGCITARSCHGSPFKNASRRHLAEKALGCPGLLRNRSGAT